MTFFMGAVICTQICQTAVMYPGLDTFDKCLTELTAFNYGMSGKQITSHVIKRSNPGFHYKSGCFEMKGLVFEINAKETAWKKFGPHAYQFDENIKRVLKGKFYNKPDNKYFPCGKNGKYEKVSCKDVTP